METKDITTDVIIAEKTQWRDIPLKMACAFSAMLISLPSIAAINDSDYEKIFGDDYTATGEINTDNATDTAENLYGVLKVGLVLAGLFFFAWGVIQLMNVGKNGSQTTTGGAVTKIIGGAVLGGAGVFFFALSGGIRSAIVK